MKLWNWVETEGNVIFSHCSEKFIRLQSFFSCLSFGKEREVIAWSSKCLQFGHPRYCVPWFHWILSVQISAPLQKINCVGVWLFWASYPEQITQIIGLGPTWTKAHVHAEGINSFPLFTNCALAPGGQKTLQSGILHEGIMVGWQRENKWLNLQKALYCTDTSISELNHAICSYLLTL